MPTPGYYRRGMNVPVAPFNPDDPEAWQLLGGAYSRPRRVTPPAIDMARRGDGVYAPAPVTYTRPRTVEAPADPLTKIAETRDYHANQTITNDDPWWKNMLRGLGRGALFGMGSGQGLAGAAGGALTGGVMGLALPAMDDRLENQAEVAKLDDRYAQEAGRQKTALGLEGLRADVEYKRAKPSLEEGRLANLERRLDLTEVYNRGRLEESAANREARVSEGDKNREVKVSEGDKNRTVRSAVAENNLKFRKEKDVADRAQRQSEYDGRMRMAQASLAERVKARVSQEAARALSAGQRAKAIRISEAKARIWAKNEGANWEDFVDALDDNGVELTK